MNTDSLKVTNDILWKGAIFFALIDVILITILVRIIKPDNMIMLKWKLIIIMSLFFCILFGSIVSIGFWNSVYSYVFPSWFRWVIPPAYGLLFSLVGLFLWWFAFHLPSNPILNFCTLGGSWGLITHILAIHRGILEKPPMLQGTNSLPALVLAMFEFIFYYSICLGFTFIFEQVRSKLCRKNTH